MHLYYFCLLNIFLLIPGCFFAEQKMPFYNYSCEELYAMGKELFETRHYTKAVVYLRQASQKNPHHLYTLVQLGLAQLACHHTKKGFESLDAFFTKEMPLEKPWHGETLVGKSITVHVPQWDPGIVFLLLRFLPMIEQHQPKSINVALNNLYINFYNSNPVFNITVLGNDFSYDIVPERSPCDYEVHLASVPHILKLKGEALKCTNYMQASSEKLKIWRNKIDTESTINVGVCCSSNNREHTRFFSEILYHVHKKPSVQLHLLQSQKKNPDSITSTKSAYKIKSHQEHDGSYADTAALISLMDIIITDETPEADLAGALGVPVFVIAHQMPAWRFTNKDTYSYWYPLMRIFPCDESNFTPTLESITRHIAELLIKKNNL